MDPKDKTTLDSVPSEQDLQTFFQEQNRLWEPNENQRSRLLAIPEKHPNAVMWNRWLLWFFPAMVVVGVLFFLNVTHKDTEQIFVPKGNLWQILYAHSEEHSKQSILTRELKNGTRLYPGDLVQFAYELKQPAHVLIVGMNQNGVVYPLVMSAEKKSLLLKPGKGALPQTKGSAKSFRLDHYTGQERFFIVRSRKVFTFKSLKASLVQAWKKAGRDLSEVKKISGPWSVMTVSFTKQPHRYGKVTHGKQH